jgi:lipid-A-disaccharide synthase
LIKVKFISLVNLIANKEVVKEMIQHTASHELVGAELLKLLHDASYNTSMKMEYERLYKLLDTGSASENTARLITQHLHQ